MNKFLIFVIISISTIMIKAQWVDIGVKGGYGLSLLSNSNLYNDQKMTPGFRKGFCYGIKAGYNINEKYEVTIEAMLNNFGQKYTYSLTDSGYTKETGIKSFSIPLLFRINGSNGSYTELGPQFTFLSKAEETNKFEFPVAANMHQIDVKPYFKSNYIDFIFGFGAYILGSDYFSLVGGFRFSYSVSDIISKKGGSGNGSNFYPFTDGMYHPVYESYKGTHPFTALFVLELNYDLGMFASSKCGKRTKFIMF